MTLGTFHRLARAAPVAVRAVLPCVGCPFHLGKVVRWDHGPLTCALQTFIGRGALPSCPSLFDGRGRGKLSMDLRACGCLLDLFVVLGTSDVV